MDKRRTADQQHLQTHSLAGKVLNACVSVQHAKSIPPMNTSIQPANCSEHVKDYAQPAKRSTFVNASLQPANIQYL
jgi:hypothetical protein